MKREGEAGTLTKIKFANGRNVESPIYRAGGEHQVFVKDHIKHLDNSVRYNCDRLYYSTNFPVGGGSGWSGLAAQEEPFDKWEGEAVQEQGAVSEEGGVQDEAPVLEGQPDEEDCVYWNAEDEDEASGPKDDDNW